MALMQVSELFEFTQIDSPPVCSTVGNLCQAPMAETSVAASGFRLAEAKFMVMVGVVTFDSCGKMLQANVYMFTLCIYVYKIMNYDVCMYIYDMIYTIYIYI